ncbi:MAG: DUF488 family protein [Candidatus Binataceae bacterium]
MTCVKESNGRVLHTIGHSTHPIGEFLGLLQMHHVQVLADVRSFPSSRKWPHFNQAELSRAIEHDGREYRWFAMLGGRRHLKRPDSPHTTWEHPAFRSYADYADTPEFEQGLADLTRLAAEFRTAIMCSEGLWWRCHRRIISDHLTLRGWRVIHIMPDGKTSEHRMTEFASIRDGRLIYDGGAATS